MQRVFDSSGAPRLATLDEQNEFDWWLVQAALIDPAALVLYKGGAFSQTVPSGETWYAYNFWNVRFTGSGGPTAWLRQIPTGQPLALPAGTTIEDNGAPGGGMAYICRPSLVASLPTYADPRALYFQRMAKLRHMPLSVINLTLTSGTPLPGAVYQAFPDDFDNGIVSCAYVMDGAWTILSGNGAGTGIVNLMNEVSDSHQWRAAHSMLLPFKRSLTGGVEAQHARRDGAVAGNSDLSGNAGVIYYKLPSDW